MKISKIVFLVAIVVTILLTGKATEAQAGPVPNRTLTQVAATGANPNQGGQVDSLSGSNVTFTPGAGGDACYITGSPQTFCFTAHSYTNDWEYVYNLWQKFPSDWTVTNAYVVGTPTCTGGGTWGTFSWSFETSPYEVNISHGRYQAYTDDCVATYCFDVVSGSGAPDALESWYWDGDGYNSAPHNPCSLDNYTPASMSGQPCDQAINAQPAIPPCNIPQGVYLLPATKETSGCNGVPLDQTFNLFNHTGAAGTFALTYAVPTANGTLIGPATVVAGIDESIPFVVTLTPDLCAIGGDDVVGTIDAAGNGFADQSVITHTVTAEPSWEAIPASAPGWAGTGYPRDSCTALNASGQWVSYQIGDTSGILGFWGYNLDTNTWFQPAPTGLPADRWAPDWAYDPATNLCYMTGGATAPGGGNLSEAYVFDPVANSFTALPSFTSARDFHNSWVGTIDGVEYLCLGGGVNSSSVMIQATQCYDLVGGAWAAENATMAVFPTDPFGAADGILHAPGGDQFWYVGGAVNAGGSISDEARYWDDADNAWHLAGNTGVPRYRVEGGFLDGAYYQVAGSSGGFTPTKDVVRGTFNGVNWTWTPMPGVSNQRMDNVVAITDDSVYSVDGYGSNASAYVERLAFCPLCDQEGFLEGNVLDGDAQPVASANSIDSLTGSFVTFDPALGGATCYTPGAAQTLCFRAESFSPDYAYVYNVWERFPTDWTVNNAYVAGTPWCDNGSWGDFSWSFETSPYEVNITHNRYQGSGGAHCIATYCFDVVAGAPAGDALESWYWAGDDYGNPPDHPCSSDVYTPASQSSAPCDESINPQALVPQCGAATPPCTGASVTINPGGIVVGVDPFTGHYGPVSLIPGDYEVTASAPGFTTVTAAVTIVDEITTTQDFILNRPVIDVNPTSITTGAPPNTPVTEQLTISNLGSVPMDWEIVELAVGVKVSAEPKVTAGTYQQKPAAVGVDPFITEQIAQSADGKVDFFIAFKDTADLSGAYNLEAKADKVAYVRQALQQAADTAQVNVRAWLERQGIQYKVHYIDNTIQVHAGQSVIDALAAFPEVSGFHGNHIYTTMPLEKLPAFSLREVTVAQAGNAPDAIIPWDLNIMSIPQVWSDLGVTGAGVIVANVDTGVYYQHEALFPNYLCGSGPHTDCWFDPDYGSTAPNDSNGHGTGTMGQMAADDDPAFQYAVGGAPDAGWIACLGCPGGSCPDTALNGCADWLVMTTPNTPDVVNNSWGTWSALCDPWYDGKIAAYRAAGIVPVWAAGNIGNACNTSTPPANSIGTLAVGATTSADLQASFSSTGPGLCSGRTQFPDISAPGDSTCSTTNAGGYSCGFGGTSFAAPRAAGCVALMKSANPSLGVQELMDVIMATADTIPNSDCGAPQPDPNYRYGEGRVNCFEAVSSVYATDNLPWVTETPVTGTIPADGFQTVDLTFECTPEQQYQVLTGTLRINHTDPCVPPVFVPLEFTCEGEPGPAVISVNPDSLASTQPHDVVTTQVMTITNSGTGPLTWDLFESLTALKTIGPKETRPAGTKVVLSSSPVDKATAAAPAAPEAAVTLVVDDGSAENNIGIGGTWEMGWWNRFTPNPLEFPFNLNQIQVLFTSGGGAAVGDVIRLTVYQDADGDPTNGATLLSVVDTTVLAIDTWSVYDLGTPVAVSGPGDVLIGVIDLEVPGVVYYPAALDQTASQGRSWAGWWLNTPPDPAIFPPDDTFGTIDSFGFAGNWLVRGYGETSGVLQPCTVPADIPWASAAPVSGLVLPGESTPVDVTFDSTGMVPGYYTGTLCIESNDLVNPLVPVPVALTVLADPSLDVAPPSLLAVQPTNQTTSQVLTLGNSGGMPLDWDIFEWMPVQKLALGPSVANKAQKGADVAPTSRSPISPAALGDALFQIPIETNIGSNLLLGAAFDGVNYWVTGGDVGAGVGMLYKLDIAGNLVSSYNEPAGCTVWGGRDLAFDGTYLYFGCDDGNIHQIDPATGGQVGTIPTTLFPPRALTYDPATDHFWMANWDSNLYEIDRSGTVINSFPPVGLSTYGMAWDAVTPGGPFLWLWSQDGDPNSLELASQVNPTTGALTGVTFAGITTSGGEMAGGMEISTELVPGFAVFVTVHQAAPDVMVVYELAPTGPVPCSDPADISWLSATPGSGSILPGNNTPVDVSFDSTALPVGVYTGTLCIESNDPLKPLVQVPVEMDVVPNPTITLVKTVGTDPSVCAVTDNITVPRGTEVTYCYLVSNTGDVALTVHDLVDSELGDLLTGFPLNLDMGTSAFITATVAITENTVNTATWTAFINPGGVSASATDTATVNMLPEADLEVVKTAPEQVNTGDTFDFTIVVTNNGPDAATAVEVVDTLPTGVTFVSASAGCVEASGVVTCAVGDLAPAGTVTITITVTAPDVEGDLTNTVVVSSPTADPDDTNNTDTTTTTVVRGVLDVFLPLMFKQP